MRFYAALVVLLLAGCDRTVPTPVGTTLVTVGAVGTPSAPFTHHARTMKFEGPAIHDMMAFEVSFDTGPADAMRDLRITVVDNKRWAVSARCNVLAPPLPGSQVWCPVKISQANGTVTFESNVEISSSGDIKASRDAEWQVD